MNGLRELWWCRLPLATRHVSRILAHVLADGGYLIQWLWAGALAPSLSLLSGFLLGAFHLSSGATFTFSLAAMGLMLLIAGASANLGLWLWMGYVLGDSILFPHSTRESVLDAFLYVRVPLCISYALLAMLLVAVPLLSRQSRDLALTRLRRFGRMPIAVQALLLALPMAVLVFVWTHAVPSLIRPIYTWRGSLPPIEAMRPLQEDGGVLMVLAVLIALCRTGLESRALLQPALAQRLLRTRLLLVATASPSIRLPTWVRLPLRVGVTTLMLSGILETWLDAALLAGALMAILVARSHLVARLGPWAHWLSYVPLPVRFVVGIAVSYLLGYAIITAMWRTNASTFRPIILSTVASLLVFSFLIPGAGAWREDRRMDGRDGEP